MIVIDSFVELTIAIGQIYANPNFLAVNTHLEKEASLIPPILEGKITYCRTVCSSSRRYCTTKYYIVYFSHLYEESGSSNIDKNHTAAIY